MTTSLHYNVQRGSALPLTLMLLTVLTATAVSVARTSVANTRLIGSVTAADTAFRLASEATHAALQTARDQPALLPAGGHINLPDRHSREGSVQISIRHLRTAADCPALSPLPGERHDYEIQVTARSTYGALSHHRQGFYVCRELCASSCIAAETPAEPSYWYHTRPDKG